MIELSKPLEFTFHRAFDKIVNPIEGVDQLIKLGVNRILTSGQEGTAIRGLKLLKELNKINNNRIIILPGAGMKTKILHKIYFFQINPSCNLRLNNHNNRLDL